MGNILEKQLQLYITHFLKHTGSYFHLPEHCEPHTMGSQRQCSRAPQVSFKRHNIKSYHILKLLQDKNTSRANAGGMDENIF